MSVKPMNTHNEYTKSINGWGGITLKLKSKETTLENKKVTIYYTVKDKETSRSHNDYRNVVHESMSKSKAHNKFEETREKLEDLEIPQTDEGFKQYENLMEEMLRGEK